MNARVLFQAVALTALMAATSSAQQFPFRLLVSQSGFAVTVQNGGTIAFNGTIGESRTARVTATYSGTGQVTVTQAPIIIGSTAFRASLSGSLPLTIQPNGSFFFDIEFLPSNAAQNNAQFSLPFTETIPPATSGGTPTIIANAFNLLFQGTAPAIVLSYVLQADQNVVPLQPGGTVVFPPTRTGTAAQAAFNVTNTGNGAGIVTGITVTGRGFRPVGLPLFPVTLAGGQNLQIGLVYEPTQVTTDSGQLTVTFGGNSTVTLNLQGSGSSPNFVYEILDRDPPVRVPAGETIRLPDADVGRTSSLVMRVTNTGNAEGVVNSVTVSGATFQITGPLILPRTLATGASMTFTVSFTPSQPSLATGFLFVNSDVFSLNGLGLGSRLEFSYSVGGTRITIGPATPSVIFSPVVISQSARHTLIARNVGSAPATIANIGLAQSSGPFSIEGLPGLPVALLPESEIQIPITFRPVSVGFANGSLVFDTVSIPLVGSGTAPPPLPAYTLTGPSGSAPPLTQTNIGLALSSPYPVAIAGTLTLGVSGNLPLDPAVQFSTGGRTVSFVIPANSTNAVFGTQGTRVGLQTGTVAGTLTLTPTFATQAGNVDLTPSTPTTLQFSVAPAAPSLISGQISEQTANGFVLSVTGFSTSRSLTTWQIQFTLAAGVNIPQSQFTVDVQQVAAAWFRSASSQNFGGQFTISIPFTFQGSLPDGGSVLNSITGISAVMNSELGASNTLQLRLR